MIRTLDPLLPKQVRYQAALYSVRYRGIRGRCGAVSARALRRDGEFIARLVRPFKRLGGEFDARALREINGL